MATYAEVIAEAEQLRKEAKVIDLCEVAQRTTEKLAEAEKKIDNFVEARESFNKKAAHAAKVLAGCGAIENDRVDEFVSKVAEDPSQVWGLVEKMAGAIPAPTLGGASDFTASRSVQDPWLKALYGESQGGSGYVD
jgi:hypothetical protein